MYGSWFRGAENAFRSVRGTKVRVGKLSRRFPPNSRVCSLVTLWKARSAIVPIPFKLMSRCLWKKI